MLVPTGTLMLKIALKATMKHVLKSDALHSRLEPSHQRAPDVCDENWF